MSDYNNGVLEDTDPTEIASKYYGRFYRCPSVTLADDAMCVADGEDINAEKESGIIDSHLNDAEKSILNAVLLLCERDSDEFRAFFRLISKSAEADYLGKTIVDMNAFINKRHG
jgi:hypothetical protein